ncbi:MAG: hypothetical protein HQK84_06055, partial [Nitrospinae bacterium]|nr:hypothetical protein [Nitrospinota bacterium]
MKPRLILHIGHPKTGTTTLQHFLQVNIDEIRKQGVLVANDQLEFPLEGEINDTPLWLINELTKEIKTGKTVV